MPAGQEAQGGGRLRRRQHAAAQTTDVVVGGGAADANAASSAAAVDSDGDVGKRTVDATGSGNDDDRKQQQQPLPPVLVMHGSRGADAITGADDRSALDDETLVLRSAADDAEAAVAAARAADRCSMRQMARQFIALVQPRRSRAADGSALPRSSRARRAPRHPSDDSE